MVCLEVVFAIARGESPEVKFCSRANWDNVSFSENGGVKLSEDKKMVQIRLDNKRSMKTFAFIMKVLSIIYRLLQEDKYCTKRDIYYQSPGLFGSQAVVDMVIDNIACMLEVPRWRLNVLATCKGLVAGSLQFYDENGRHIDCNNTKMGVQIPAHDKDMLYLHTDAQFVLIVEKDATFQTLLGDNFCQKFPGKAIIITGKGFPDIGTRLLVHKIWETFQLPTFALMDADPHGIGIMLVYKYGSKAQAFENQHLVVPAIKWLGILPTDIPRLPVEKDTLMQQTEQDLRKLVDLLNRPYMSTNSKMAHQIEAMIQCGIKAELQCLDSIHPSYLTDIYLPSKIHMQDWI